MTTETNQPSLGTPSGKKQTLFVRTLVSVAMMTALAAVLQLLEFPLPFAPAWLKLDFSDLPALIVSFAFGPWWSAACELLKNLLFMAMRGTTSGGVGELANFLLGSALCVPAGLVYARRRMFKGALAGLFVGLLAFAVAGCVLNYYVLLPFYLKVMPLETILAIAQNANAHIQTLADVVWYGVLPFNLVKGIAVGVLTLLLYKRISPLLKKFLRHE